jgi:hypothetical protein
MSARRSNELIYLLPFALQEEVLRNPGLTCEQRVKKVILSFKRLLRHFHLSSFPLIRVSPSGLEKQNTGFDTRWSGVLSSAVVLTEFINSGTENWSFSRLGTHCSENFLV